MDDLPRPFPATQFDILHDLSRALNPNAPYGREVARYWIRGFWLIVERMPGPVLSARVTWHALALTFENDHWDLRRVEGKHRMPLHQCKRVTEAVACLFAEMALTKIEPLPPPPIEPERNRHWRGPYAKAFKVRDDRLMKANERVALLYTPKYSERKVKPHNDDR